LKEWSENLVKELMSKGLLPSDVLERRDQFTGAIHSENAERVAVALEQHLAQSGEYGYSLELTRDDYSIDPTLDFLMNTKSGHCNRFASGLALMLRSLGIPCQLVSGYRGVELRSDGTYEVRQCQAHTWVEAIIERRDADPAHGMRGGRRHFHWL